MTFLLLIIYIPLFNIVISVPRYCPQTEYIMFDCILSFMFSMPFGFPPMNLKLTVPISVSSDISVIGLLINPPE